MPFRLPSLLILIALLVAALPFVPRAVVPDNALTVWFLEDDPALVEYRAFHEQFGNDEVVLLGYRKPDGLFDPVELERLRRLTADLEAIPGVSRVVSLANVQDVDPESGLFEPVLADGVMDPQILASPLLSGRIVNADGTMTLVWITMDVMEDIDERRDAIIAVIREVAEGVLGPGEARLGGMGVIYSGLNEITRRDFGLFMGLSYLLMFALMFALFRRLSFVLLAIAVVATATFLTLGATGLAGSRLNLVTVMLPTIVSIFGIADVIHVLNRAGALAAAGVSGNALARETLRQVWRPCLYTSLTTGAAFLSFYLTEMRVLREFGVFTAVGIISAFVATMVLSATALLFVGGEPQRAQRAQRMYISGYSALSAVISSIWRWPGRYALLLGLATLVALAGARQLVVDTYTLGYLPADHRVVQDHHFLETHWGPYATLEMTVRPLGDRDLRTPEVLESIGAFSDAVISLPAITGAFSLHTVLDRLSDVRYGDDRLLRSRLVLDNMLADLDEDELEQVVTDDFALGRITLTGRMASAAELGRHLDQIAEIAARHFDRKADVRFAGYPPLYVNIIQYVMRAQITSFWVALLLIFVLILVFLRDLKLALIAMIPNLFPVVLIFGVMGMAGITLDVATATVAAIVLGVAIDDTIHMLYHFREARALMGTREALEKTLQTAGRAVVITSIVLALGFTVLMLASVKTVFYFGLLTALAMIGALVGDLILLPLLLKLGYQGITTETTEGTEGKRGQSGPSLCPLCPLWLNQMTEDANIPRIPHRGHYSADKCEERLEWLREQTGAPLEKLGEYDIDPQELQGNIENFIGMAQVPVGVAGPLLIHGDHIHGHAYAPLATTEGALVASAARGARGLTIAGGVRVRFVHQHMVRAPLFILDTMADAFRLRDWIEAHTDELHVQVRHTSSHATLISLRPFVLGNALHLRFVYNTGDASGQNMTTACTWKACQWILDNVRDLHIRHFVIEANMSGDKKVSFLSYVDGRGVRVMAETFVPEGVLESVFKVSSKELLETVHAFMAGSLHAGMVGFNINVANTIAAIFTATGQDIGSVHESAIGQLSVRPAEGGIYASLLLPTLVIGTVGGGTALPTQRECLELMGCYGAGKLGRFAEIIAGYALALDLSTLSAISGGQFATAHEKLGRNRPEDGLKEEHLTPEFFAEALGCEKVDDVEPFDIDTSSSILSSLTGTQLKKKVGHYPYRIRCERGDVKVVVKAKPVDTEVINMLNVMAKGCGGELATRHEAFKTETGFRHCHIRELAVHGIQDDRFKRITPHVFRTWRDDRREIFVLVMEYLEGLSHMNTEDNTRAWQPEHIRAVLRDLAGFHAIHYGRTEELEAAEWIERPTADQMMRMRPLLHALVYHHAREFPALYTRERAVMVHRIINRMGDFWPALEAAPKTLVHNDFNSRNIALREEGGGYRLCAYDWELATVNVPQRDVVEFLAFVLPPETSAAERLVWVHVYRQELEAATGTELDAVEFERVFNMASLDFLVNRLGLYTMAHVFKDYAFLPRVLEGQFGYVEEVTLAYLRAQSPQE